MSNKEKNKEPYLLQDEQNLDEFKDVIKTIISPKEVDDAEGDKKKGAELTKAIQSAKKPENVDRKDDGSIEITQEGDLKEYQETEGYWFDKLQIKGGDEKEFLKFLQAVSDGKVKIGTPSLGPKGDPTLNNKGKIITAESFKKMVNNFNKIDLSESEIISIIEETQNPRMKKSELMETIQNNLISEAQMNDNVRQNFESGDNDYNDILGQELTNQLAQESFQEIADNIRRKTGKRDVTIADVQRLLGGSLMEAAKEEFRVGTESLERKAVEMIRKQYKIPKGAIEFDAKIVGIPPQMLVGGDMSPEEMEQLSNQAGVKVGKINRQGLKMTKGNKPPPQGKTNDELKPQIKRRRLTNSMIHGAARKSQNLHHMDDQLRQENPELGRNYSNVMSANDANYFLLDDETIKREGESGIHAGNNRLDLSDPKKPKIIAEGMIFPILLHELSKGVAELMSLWGMSKLSSEEKKYILDKTDNLSSETNDIRLGAKIWERFVEQIPVNNQEAISLTFNMLQELSDSEFNSVIEGLIRRDSDAQNKIRRMAEEALSELQRESSDDAFGGYDDSPEQEGDNNDDDDVLTPPEEPEGEDVNPTPNTEEPEEVDYNDLSTRELQDSLDDALDSGDMELVRYIGSILNSR